MTPAEIRPDRTTHYDQLPVHIYPTTGAMARAAAARARDLINQAMAERGQANVAFATGNSQAAFLETLRDLPGIDWSKVSIFHLDNYLGLPADHPALIPPRLRRHIVDGVRPHAFYAIPSTGDMDQVCRDYERLLREHPLDVLVMGWGENGHMAFNDPHCADFDDPAWLKVVTLSEESRRQVVGEGRFGSLQQAATQAITMTVPALLSARHILCVVPEGRKAPAVQACLTEPIGEAHPGSILRRVPYAELYLDGDSASLL